MLRCPRYMLTVLVLWALTVHTYVLCQSNCAPAEEGQSYTIECNVPGRPNDTSTGTVQWNEERSGRLCNCQGSFPGCVCWPGYSGTMQGSTTQGYTSVLTINNPLKNLAGSRFMCESGGSQYTTCNLGVFVRATNPRCQVQDPGPSSNTDVVVTCEDDDIFPRAACQFNKKTNNNGPSNLPESNSAVTVETGRTSCTLRVAGTYLGRGDHQFRVVMYPSITNVTYGVASGYTDVITIGDPSVELRDCPTVTDVNAIKNGYIKEGTSATCTCTRTDQTYFSVDISWKNKNGGTVVNVSQAPSATLTFTATKDQAFTCSVKNSLQWTKEVTYTPQVAYGPSNEDVTLEPPSQGTIDLCQSGDETFTVQCQVSASSVVPSATFSYTVNTTTSSVVPSDPTVGSTNTATVTVTQGGTYGVYCVVKNSVFPDIQADNSVSILVREPPSAPIIEISQTSRVRPTSGGILTVEEGEANVTCHVTGGYPQVTKLRLSCGEDKTVTNTNTQTQSVSFTRNMNGQSCSCVATHDSTCYSSSTTTYMLDVQYRCDAAEEGSNHNIFYYVTGQQMNTVSWYQRKGSFPTVLATCTRASDGITFTCTSRDPSKYQIQENNNNITLTILSVSRVGLLPYLVYVNGIQVFSCNLDVYAKPESPRCQPPTLISDKTALSVSCSTDKVFPQAQCAFHKQGVQGDLSDVSYTQESYTTSDGLIYYKSTCTLTYPVNTTGSYAFVVEMFVSISNRRYGLQQSPVSDSITLTLPEGGLATDCFSGDNVKDGYIKSGTTATCRCDRVHDGLPVGQVQWYNTAGQPVGTMENGGMSATITVPTSDTVQNFTCKGKSVLGMQSTGQTFSLKVAYGPTQVNVSPASSTSTTIDLCPNTNHDITIQCQVPRDDVTPQLSFSVLFNGTSKPGVNPGSDVYMYRVTGTLDTAGTLSVTCRAVNSVFSDLSKEDNLQIVVREPPSSPPQLIINNNQPVVENVLFTVSCRVDGGFPLVSGVSVTCMSAHNMTSVTSDTNVLSQSMTFRRDMDGAQCDCVAQHVTGCYSNNQASVKLNVTYKAAIKIFTANHNHTLTVDLHDSINLTCVTDGNPTPIIIIQNHRAIQQKEGEGHSLTYVNDNVACTDTAVYSCQANNFLSMDESSKAEVQVFVRCPQQPQHADNVTFSGVVGASVTLDLDVIGYPAPRTYILRQGKTVVAQVTTADGNGRDGSYQFNYLSDDPPFGTVQLTIGNLSKEHFTKYLLTIDNGVGQALEYNFVLEKAVPSSETDDGVVAIAVGVTCGILALIVVAIIIIAFKRQGMLQKCGDFSKRSDDAKNSTDIGQHNGVSVYYNQPAGQNGHSDGTVYNGGADKYIYENTVETASVKFQSTSPSSPSYENVVPPLEPASADSHSPYEN